MNFPSNVKWLLSFRLFPTKNILIWLWKSIFTSLPIRVTLKEQNSQVRWWFSFSFRIREHRKKPYSKAMAFFVNHIIMKYNLFWLSTCQCAVQSRVGATCGSHPSLFNVFLSEEVHCGWLLGFIATCAQESLLLRVIVAFN